MLIIIIVFKQKNSDGFSICRFQRHEDMWSELRTQNSKYTLLLCVRDISTKTKVFVACTDATILARPYITKISFFWRLILFHLLKCWMRVWKPLPAYVCVWCEARGISLHGGKQKGMFVCGVKQGVYLYMGVNKRVCLCVVWSKGYIYTWGKQKGMFVCGVKQGVYLYMG